MYTSAMVMSLKGFVCILRSCISVLSVLSVLMTCGALTCVNVVADLMYVMRPPPWLCSCVTVCGCGWCSGDGEVKSGDG